MSPTSSSLCETRLQNIQRTLKLVIDENDSIIYFNVLSWGNTAISSGSGKDSTLQNYRKPPK